MVNQQAHLNKLLGECQIDLAYQEEDAVNTPYEEIPVLKPEEYHKNRALNSIFAIEGDIIERINEQTGQMRINEESRQLAKKFRKKSKPPAGGWYLVKEQREWLKTQLYDLLAKKPNTSTVSIMEAGVASYIHHFTYVSLLKEVLVQLKKELGWSIHIQLNVLEKYSYPLYQIRAITNVCKLDKDDPLYPYPDDPFLDFLEESEVLDFEPITVRLIQYDLQKAQKGPFQFDIITEHFLTSVIKDFEGIRLVREGYANILLKAGGSLLCASGVVKSQPLDYENYMNLHKKSFQLIGSETVWDPYGMKLSEMMDLLEGDKKVMVDYDNTLFHFQRKLKSDN
jgi:hypothetical protein